METQEEFDRKREEAQVYQAVMMAKFKESQEFRFLLNLIEVLKINWWRDRKSHMKTQSAREMTLYTSGQEDGLKEFLEMIDKTIADGEAIRMKNELVAQYKEG